MLRLVFVIMHIYLFTKSQLLNLQVMWLNMGVVKTLAAPHCFWIHNDQTLIPNQTRDDSRVFGVALTCSVSVLGSLWFFLNTWQAFFCTAHATVPWRARRCSDLRLLCVHSAPLETLRFHYGKQSLSLFYYLTNSILTCWRMKVAFAVRCIRIFESPIPI